MFYPTTCVRLGYGPADDMFSGFSWEYACHRCRIAPKGAPYCRVSALEVDLPASVDAYLASTHYSVSARVCRSSVAASLIGRVTEY